MAMAVSSTSCVYWEWQRDDGGFSPYPPNNSNAIEAANHAGLGGHNSGTYTIDFGRMIQRKNATGVYMLADIIKAFWLHNSQYHVWGQVVPNFLYAIVTGF